jgi:hypothetical protein
MEIKDKSKYPHVFTCAICEFHSTRKSHYDKHLLTTKHKKTVLGMDSTLLCSDFTCKCGKLYMTMSGLWKHKYKCKTQSFNDLNNKSIYINDAHEIGQVESNDESMDESKDESKDVDNTDVNYQSLFLKLIKDNSEFKELLFKQQEQMSNYIKDQNDKMNELIPKIESKNTYNTNTYHNSNNINQRFNINLFLNEQCKNAINLDDFIKSIKVDLEQLDYTKNNGLANGLTHIIMENIKNLNIYERPLHCTDIKRETLYIKTYNNWTKDVDNANIKNAINKISTKQFGALNTWIQENPDYATDDAKQYYYAKTLSIIGKPTNVIDNKIIKKLCNENHVKNLIDK